MVLFRFTPANESLPVVRGEGVYLRAPQMADYEAWASLREASRAFLEPWEPIWPADDLTRPAFRRRVRRYAEEIRSDMAYPFFLFREADGVLLGGLTLGLVRRGVAQACTLGYWMGAAYARQGYMTHGVRAATRFAFSELGLRRIEAACLPSNEASIRLLEKAGFTREGYARRYLCIAGSWQDHLLYALLRDDPVR
ncbi:GNAT family protein [Chelatococcus sp. SYSU_G07232]|uniref:GNAT family protein n=1 Tax=Chelatococcus albus TaxID=3047466 RepID=A0ABT7AES6_9HYPH|nr:GNAT family protein [Chelatococcus sp. SYSU_G07232]MDJ1157860.1 GNAT family protein [Chelatococcus sp. SYSU_G07232]